jgi:alanine racemase
MTPDPTTGFRPTVATIDLGAIRANVSALTPPSARLMAVVKADAYGHGAVPVARAAVEAGATWLGVALVEEGMELRGADISAPILVLTEFPPGSERDALAASLTPAVYTQDGMRRLVRAATGAAVGVHVKVDTGMHRAGLPWTNAEEFCRDVLEAGLRIDALWTHFATADEPEDPFLDVQLQRFLDTDARLRAIGIAAPLRHAANSAAAMRRPDTHFDVVRVGIAMYGVSPGPALDGGAASLRPAMTLGSRVALSRRVPAGEAVSYGLTYRVERDSSIATVPVGYADGYPRSLSNRAQVLIAGKRFPVAGTVTMDQVLVDCADHEVCAGNEVVLLGRQGDEAITAGELARLAGTIGYEIVCGVGARVPRRYTGVQGGSSNERSEAAADPLASDAGRSPASTETE